MGIYTKNGDDGSTSLINSKRVFKDSTIVECLGTIDELNALIGIAIATYNTIGTYLQDILIQLQDLLINMRNEILGGKTIITINTIKSIEQHIDKLSSRLIETDKVILPRGTIFSTQLYYARSVCMRLERALVKEKHIENTIQDNIIILANRLSDLFFVMARFANKIEDVAEKFWKE